MCKIIHEAMLLLILSTIENFYFVVAFGALRGRKVLLSVTAGSQGSVTSR